ncbi:outer membrane beta-barrel protein [Pedobacter sp. MC2016-14]|uniref:outer membrane beta-barrel protein n=1 Tax=Pedobacter sp. MC2016-14 TaxID=2897327 RepID=UPI001E4C9C9A|nr:outer membrane beta-barrel protein [Pedobacter sp. MC2016-14]MCD0487662.1 outer membrane beta-barrel protein [Pedobacter sp. MC2016-14]
MHKIIVLSIMLLASNCLLAQNKASIKGLLIDSVSKSPLEFATVAVVNAKDTSLISYTLSDKNGVFKLNGISLERPTRVIISYVGYKTHRQALNILKGEMQDLGTIILATESLNEVIIKGERSPIVVKKDTIEFNTEAFKTRPNAVVEDLLKKLPGVQVNADGTIQVNGKSISKLLIDGKEFFGNDPKVATRNLDADMIDKIQVYDDRENDPNHKISAAKVNKIINLKLKSKIKKSTIGKIYAGGGSRSRYETGAILSSFRDTLQVSLIGLANNLSKTGFSNDDLYNMGGFGRSGGSQIWDGTLGGRGWGGIEKVAAGGFNINNDYGKKLKINLVYFHTNTKTATNGDVLSEQFLPETKLTSAYNYRSDQQSLKNALSGLVEWNPDTLNRYRYEPKLEINSDKGFDENTGNTFNTIEPRLTETNQKGQDLSRNTSFNHSFSYNRRLKKKEASISISHSLSLNTRTSDNYSVNNLTSYTTSLPSVLQDRYIDNGSKSSSGMLSIEFSYPITKQLFTEISSGTNYLSTKEGVLTYDKNSQTNAYDQLLTDQSNELKRDQFTHNIQPKLGFKFTDEFKLKIGFNASLQDVNNHFSSNIGDIKNSYFNLFPSISLEGAGYSINYYEHIEQPSISDIQPIVRQYSTISTFTGNPELKPKYNRNISGSYYKYISAKQININAGTDLTLSQNNVVRRNMISANGVSSSTPLNRDGGMSGYLYVYLGKQFKKSQNWQIGLNTSLSSRIDKNAFFLNADEGVQYQYQFRIGQDATFNYKELLDLASSYSFSKSITSYKNVDYISRDNYTHSLSTSATLKWPKKIVLDTKYSYVYNPQFGAGFQKSTHTLNMSLALLMFKKDRGQLKLSVYDLFDQNISNYRSANENSIVTYSSAILKRYFLLTYQYKLNVFKGK